MSEIVPAYYPQEMMTNQVVTPNTVVTARTGLVEYYKRYLLQKAFSVFRFALPDTWDRSYFLYVLYCMGFIGVFRSYEYGVIAQRCGLFGYNIWERPTKCIFASPFYSTKELTIGRECILIRLTPDYCGIMDLVTQYAELMALTMSGVSVNLLNSRLAYVFYAGTKAEAESYKSLFDRVASGEPAVVASDKLRPPAGSDRKAWEPFAQNLRNTFIAPEMLESLKAIENRFATDIGLPNANTDKRERMIVDEVNANNAETGTRCALWLEQLKEDFNRVNTMFGTALAVDWRVNPMQGGGASESDTDNNRTL